jgi:hypothetical protein
MQITATNVKNIATTNQSSIEDVGLFEGMQSPLAKSSQSPRCFDSFVIAQVWRNTKWKMQNEEYRILEYSFCRSCLPRLFASSDMGVGIITIGI